MSFLWDLLQNPRIENAAAKADLAESTARRTESKADRQLHQIHDLELQVDRLSLVVMGLCELLIESQVISREELQATIDEIDVRDGVKDGRVRASHPTCPDCGRPNHRQRTYCLYCGAALPSTGLMGS